MGDCWDYKQRKMEIAWDLAKDRIKQLTEKEPKLSDENYWNQAEKEVSKAWAIVDSVHPRHDGKG